MALPRFFAWCDLECTGLDENLDPILEIGLVLTEVGVDCREVDCLTAVTMPKDPDWKDRMDEYVLRMHTLNGLIGDVERVGRPIREVESEILTMLMKWGRPHNFMLAGSGVSHYDRRFIKRQMPGFDKWLQHPSFDVGTFRRGLTFCGRKDLDSFGQTFDGNDKPHRGMADVRDHLNEWRQYASILQSLPEEG